MPHPGSRSDLIHRPGEGTRFGRAWCRDPSENRYSPDVAAAAAGLKTLASASMRCMITASLRASATLALRMPALLAIRIAELFRAANR